MQFGGTGHFDWVMLAGETRDRPGPTTISLENSMNNVGTSRAGAMAGVLILALALAGCETMTPLLENLSAEYQRVIG